MELTEELKRLKDEFYLHQRLNYSLSRTTDLKRVFKVLSEAILYGSKDDICIIFLIDREDKNIIVLEHVQIGFEGIENDSIKNLFNDRIDIRECDFVKKILEEKIPSVNDNVENTLRGLLKEKGNISKFFDIKSFLLVPLLVENNVEGFALVSKKDIFKKDEIERIHRFMEHGGLAVERTNLYRETKERYKELEVLYELGTKISSLIRLDDILPVVMDGIKEIISYDVGTIGLLDEKREKFEIYKVRGMTEREEVWFKSIVPAISKEFISWAIGENIKEPRFIEVKKDPPPIDPKYLRYFLNMPLAFENELIGLITLGRIDREFKKKNAKTMTIMASQIAGLMKRAKEYQEELEKKNIELFALSHSIGEISENYKFDKMIGKNHKMRDIFNLIRNIADTDATFLIQGETGTGKELIARSIHFNSNRKDKPFIKVNCSSIPETLLESELFGYVKGAFTGAHRDRIGRFELADKGTLFLDEVGDIPLSMQIKLLRVLQEMEFERIGSNKTIKVDVRIIAATNQNLEELIKEGKFRKDLFYRLNVVPIHLPPLRERKDDIILLTMYFLRMYTEKYKKDIKEIAPEGLNQLLSYHWPGNVRELENIIERAVLMERGDVIKSFDISTPYHKGIEEINGVNYQKAKEENARLFEREYFSRLLRRYKGNISKVAIHSGINRKSLYLIMKKCNLRKEDFKE